MNEGMWRTILILLCAGCVATRSPQPSPTVPATQSVKQPVDSGPWAFTYRPDTLHYHVSRSAIIETQSDSEPHREIATNDTHEILALSLTSDTVRYIATVDSFSTAVQGLIGTVPTVTLPVQISGVLNPMAASSDSTIPAEPCDPVQSSLESDVQSLLINLPGQFTTGTSWQDSTVKAVCYGTIPMWAVVLRKFTVVGRLPYDEEGSITVQRVDTITARGEGRQQQHHLTVEATGRGSATYQLNPGTSSLLHLTVNQSLDFLIRVSGRTNRFRETAKEEYRLLR